MKKNLHTTKTLLLLRHAKSSWKDETLPDFERPLNTRGRRAAEIIGRYLRTQKVLPDLIVSSPAFRARETIEIVIKASRVRSELRYDERIYEASPRRLLEVINEIEDERKTVLLVGHNPGMEQLLELLTGEVQVMPTAALASIAVRTTAWNALSDGQATLEWLIKPKDLDEH